MWIVELQLKQKEWITYHENKVEMNYQRYVMRL